MYAKALLDVEFYYINGDIESAESVYQSPMITTQDQKMDRDEALALEQ